MVEPTYLKNMLVKLDQIGSFPQIGVKIKTHLKPPPRREITTIFKVPESLTALLPEWYTMIPYPKDA